MRLVPKEHRMASRGGHTGLCLEAKVESSRTVDQVKHALSRTTVRPGIGVYRPVTEAAAQLAAFGALEFLKEPSD